MQNRAITFGSRSVATSLLILSIVGLLNFVGARNETRIDLTKNKRNTLSDQTLKLVRELKAPVRAVYFAKLAAKEQVRPFLESYRSINPEMFKLEFVDPDKQPARAREAGVKRYGTLQLIAQKSASQEIGGRDIQVEELTEEKITNALLKILKDRTPQLCVLTGHGEKAFTSAEADGFESMRKSLLEQAYEVREINLVTEGSVPASCSALAIWGPTKAFFPQELDLLSNHLKKGGRLIVGVDMNLGGPDAAAELNPLLAPWGLQYDRALLIDPSIRALELDASVLIVNQFSRTHPVSKDFTTGVALPFTRPIRKLDKTPDGLKIESILSTSAQAWGENNLKELAAGKAGFNPGSEKQGVLSAAMAVEGKNSRVVAFGSASFAGNSASRMLNNSDLFLNAVAWTLEDDASIAIRPKDAEPGKLELTATQGRWILLLTSAIVPLMLTISGIGFWAYRRKL